VVGERTSGLCSDKRIGPSEPGVNDQLSCPWRRGLRQGIWSTIATGTCSNGKGFVYVEEVAITPEGCLLEFRNSGPRFITVVRQAIASLGFGAAEFRVSRRRRI
jgi:hypothetical protein